MKYFINEEDLKALGSTCYFEFQKGKHKNKHWLKESIYIHADLFDTLLLIRLFSDSVETFNYYGPNIIEKNNWLQIVAHSKENEQWKSVVTELSPWVDECFAKYDCFTICGI